MLPVIFLPALILQTPIPLVTLRVWIFGSYVVWYTANVTQVWMTDPAGNFVTMDLPPRGVMFMPPGTYIVHARGVKQEEQLEIVVGP